MTELEVRYLLERAAGAAEACVELGCPEHIRSFVTDGYDAAGVRQALAGGATERAASTGKPGACAFGAAAPASSRPRPPRRARGGHPGALRRATPRTLRRRLIGVARSFSTSIGRMVVPLGWPVGAAQLGGVPVTISDSPPPIRADGQLWFDESIWRLFISYLGFWWQVASP